MAYYFPPLGGGGVQRSLQFVRHLPQFGYEPVVVTGTGESAVEAPTDESLLARLGPGTAIRRVRGPEPSRRRTRAGRILRRPSAWSRWWPSAVAEASAGADVELVFATMSPFESARATTRLAAELGVPWVADLRDPWALDEWRTYPTGLHRRLERREMGRALSSAAAVVMNTEEAVRAVREQLPELAGVPVLAIPNGYDADDFSGPRPRRDDKAFRIVHAGWSHVESGTQHRKTAGLDILPRSHVFLVEAVDRAGLPEVEVHLVGHGAEPAHDAVTALGYLPHDRAIEAIRSADLLFLPMHDLPPGMRSTIVPGKTYEYLAAGRPILAAVPDGDARDLLIASGGAIVVRPRDVAGMAEAIRKLVERKRRGEPPPRPSEESTAPFERRALTGQLAELFERVLR
jgi:glycosyltransferase involved in cell wall biosynthesis